MGKDKVVLAYSGGLDTSVAIKWLEEKYNLDVIAVTVDVGQIEELDKIRERGLKIGAKDFYLIDAKEEFAQDFILKALKANALYEGKYPLVSSLSRPLIAKHLVKVAEKVKASFVAHGCTGKGNDQVRFEVSIVALNPELKIIAPIREWKMSRQEAIEYAQKHDIPVEVTKKSPYSVDENLWGRTIECGILEDPWLEPPEEAFKLTVAPEQASEKPKYLEIAFEKGKPVALNGKNLPLIKIINQVNKIAGESGFGRVDMIENRLVGIKSREVYEVPGALSLITAHCDLEDLTLERELLHFKSRMEIKYAELIYYGLWYSPLKEALDAFFEKTQESVSGTVKLKYYKGSCQVVGRKSEKALYDYSLATYEKREDLFSHDSAKGFIELFGLPIKTWAKKKADG